MEQAHATSQILAQQWHDEAQAIAAQRDALAPHSEQLLEREAELAQLQSAHQTALSRVERLEEEVSRTEAARAEREVELAQQRAERETLLAAHRAELDARSHRLAELEGEREREGEAAFEAQANARALAEASTARIAELELKIAEVEHRPEPQDVSLDLRAAGVREDALKRERERLAAEVEDLRGLYQANETERLRLAEIAEQTGKVMAELTGARAELAAAAQRAGAASEAHDLTKQALEEEKARFHADVARATAKSGLEAKMLRELSERQAAELKELRVSWARGSTELTRLKAAHEALTEAEVGARTALQQLKDGKGILAASNLADAMGIDVARIERLEQRIRELEAQLEAARGS